MKSGVEVLNWRLRSLSGLGATLVSHAILYLLGVPYPRTYSQAAVEQWFVRGNRG